MSKRIIIALDFETVNQAKELLTQLDPSLCRVKIGKELFVVAGPDLVRDVVSDERQPHRTGVTSRV